MTRHRSRILAALVALLTFSAAFGEQVWASTCDGAMRMGNPSQAEAMAGMHHAPAPPHQPVPQSPECPLAAALAANGGCIFTCHPAPALAAPEPQAPLTAAVLPTRDDAPGILFASSPFRPPKA